MPKLQSRFYNVLVSLKEVLQASGLISVHLWAEAIGVSGILSKFNVIEDTLAASGKTRVQ